MFQKLRDYSQIAPTTDKSKDSTITVKLGINTQNKEAPVYTFFNKIDISCDRII